MSRIIDSDCDKNRRSAGREWSDGDLGDNMTIGRVRDGLKSLSACINSVVKSISAGSFAGKSPKQCHKLSNLVADRTGIVDNEVVVVVEYLAKKHKSIMKQLLLSSQLEMQRSGELREFTLCTESKLCDSVIAIVCIALEDFCARQMASTVSVSAKDFANMSVVDSSSVLCGWDVYDLYAHSAHEHEHEPEPENENANDDQQEQDHGHGFENDEGGIEHQHQCLPLHGYHDQHAQNEQNVANECVPHQVELHSDPNIDSFLRNYDDLKQEKILHFMLRRAESNLRIVVPARNGRHTEWFHIKRALTTQTWENHKKNLPKDTLTEILNCIGGSSSKGIELISRRMYGFDEDAFLKGMRAGGGNGHTKYAPEDTVGLQSYVGLTWRQMQRLSQVLSKYNGNSPVLSSYKACRKLRSPRELQYQYLTYEYTETSELMTEKTISLNFRVADPREALFVALTNLRDGPQFDPDDDTTPGIGRDFGTAGNAKAIGSTLYADCGNTDTRFMLSLLALPGTSIDACVNIGSYSGKESHFLIRNTVAPIINSGLEELKATSIIVLQWIAPDIGFDFLMLPCAGILVGNVALTRDSSSGIVTVHWSNHGVPTATPFERRDIPLVYEIVAMPIELFACFDLSMAATDEGRPTYASTRCSCCDLLHRDTHHGNDWQNCRACGELLTVQRMNAVSDEYLRTHDTANSAGISKAEKVTAEKESEKLGMFGLHVLFPAIELDHIIVPVLHEVLGLVLILYNRLYEFVEDKLEVVPQPMAEKRAALEDAEQQLHAIGIQLGTLPTAGATAEQRAERAALMNDKKEQKSISRSCKAEMEKLKKMDKGYFVVSNQLDAIFAEYHITRTEYSNNSLVGCHCAAFLEEWPLIRQQVCALFKGPSRRHDVADNINYEVDQFLNSMNTAIEALYVLRLYMYSSTVLTSAECSNFKFLAEFFVGLFRTDPWLKRSITPKMHLLETHAPVQMVQYGGCLSQFLEENIEREHRVCKQLNLQYNLMTDWHMREKAIMARLQTESRASVQLFRREMIMSTKRAASDATLEKKEQKKQAKAETLADRKGEIMLKVNQAKET